MKTCSICSLTKPLEEFDKPYKNRDVFKSYCKSCRRIKLNSKYDRVKNAQKYKENCEILKARSRAYSKKNFRKKNLRDKFGITLLQYEILFAQQKGKCAICGADQKTLKRRLAVDHSHDTGKIRGLLCSRCNLGIGFFKDSIELLKKSIRYLKK